MNAFDRLATRREFLKRATVLAAAPCFIPAAALGKGPRPAPSNRITLGFLGLGSMGLRHVNGFKHESDCQILALCDVDRPRREEAARLVNEHYGNRDCRQYADFRDVIASPDVDALCVSLPDHWHSIPVLMAVRAGKDIYGEKPLALTIAEGRAMVEAVNRTDCVWQTGSWQRSTAHFRRACELARNGRIGTLQKVEVGIGRGPRIEPQPQMPVPEGFDYEMWLGPAPWAPYTEKRCHWNFRWILDYSGGQVTDSGAHHIDIAHWGMGKDHTGPIEVKGVGKFPEDGLWNAAVTHRFTCRYAKGPPLCVGSHDYYPEGIRFTGDLGWIHVARGGMDAHPKSVLRERIGPEEIRLYEAPPDRQGHRRNFLDCVKTRARTITPIEIGHRSIAVAHLGNIAMLTGRTIRWDPETERILGDPEASRMLSRPMRAPWGF